MALTAPAPGGFALVAAELGVTEARQRARARHRAAFARSQTLCEDLAERLSWLHRPDDTDLVAEVVSLIRHRAAALEVCVGRLPSRPPEAPMAVQELLAIVDVVDAEVRLATLGDPGARQRAQQMARVLRAGAAALAHEGA